MDPAKTNGNPGEGEDQSVVNAVRFSPDDPPTPLSADIWNRIDEEIAPSSPANTPIAWPRFILPLAAALLLLALGGGFLVGRLTAPDAEVAMEIPVQMRSGEQAPPDLLRYLEDLDLFVLDASMMPLPEGDAVYQVWIESPERGTVSVGVIDADNPTLAFAHNLHQLDRLYVTIEPGPFGSESPTDEPMGEAILND